MAGAAINALKSVFARHGIPQELVADNNPFGSYEFRSFAREWGFKFTPSSPHYKQSNGQAERYVGVVKNMLRKSSKGEIYIALLQYRNTPLRGIHKSPAELLMGRRLNDKLVTPPRLLLPQGYDTETVRENLRARQLGSERMYNRGALARDEFKEGDWVRHRYENKGIWERAVVTGKAETPRSYFIRAESGAELRRSAAHLRPSPDAPVDTTPILERPPGANQVQPVAEQPIMPNPAVEGTPAVADQNTCDMPRRSNRIRQAPARYGDCVRY